MKWIASILSSIFGWFKSEPKDKEESIFVKFELDDNNEMYFTCRWPKDCEKQFAELMYNIHSGAVLGSCLEVIIQNAERDGTTKQSQKMTEYLVELYDSEEKEMEKIQEAFLDSPIINPSEVFGNKDEE